MKDSIPLKTRALGAFAGFLGGGILGIILLVFAMVLARSDFGLDSIRPETLVSAIVGAILGFYWPEKALKVLGGSLKE